MEGEDLYYLVRKGTNERYCGGDRHPVMVDIADANTYADNVNKRLGGHAGLFEPMKVATWYRKFVLVPRRMKREAERDLYNEIDNEEEAR